MATHSSILAWKRPWTEKPSRLVMGSQRVGHNSSDLACTPVRMSSPMHHVVKNLPANAGVTGSNPGSGRSHGGENGNPLQSSCLENPTDRGAWWATVHGVTENWT